MRRCVTLLTCCLASCAVGLQGSAGLALDTNGELAFEARFDGMVPTQVEGGDTYVGLPMANGSLGVLDLTDDARGIVGRVFLGATHNWMTFAKCDD